MKITKKGEAAILQRTSYNTGTHAIFLLTMQSAHWTLPRWCSKHETLGRPDADHTCWKHRLGQLQTQRGSPLATHTSEAVHDTSLHVRSLSVRLSVPFVHMHIHMRRTVCFRLNVRHLHPPLHSDAYTCTFTCTHLNSDTE